MRNGYDWLRQVSLWGAGALTAWCLMGTAVARASDVLSITSATWRPERAELKVEGTSRRVDEVVLVRDAVTKKLLGGAAVRRDGKWVLKVREPAVVPSRMQVESAGTRAECAVAASQDATAVLTALETPPAQ